jgi:hypothetical protein
VDITLSRSLAVVGSGSRAACGKQGIRNIQI